MATEVIVFESPRPRDGTGEITPEASAIPIMRPVLRATPRQLAKRLADALESLSKTPCSFWACKGPTGPRHMCTCTKCWAMRDIAAVMATLEKKGDEPCL